MLSRILANLMMKFQILSRLIENNLSFHTHTHTEIPSSSTYTSRVLRLFWKTALMFSHHPGPLFWQLCPPSITGVRPFLQLPPFSNTMKGALALDKVWGEFFFTWKVKPTKCNWLQPKPIQQQNVQHPENLFHSRLLLSKSVIISGEVSAKCSNLIVSKLEPKLLINLWP